MTTAQLRVFKNELADAERIAESRKIAQQDTSAEAVLSLVRRELQAVEIDAIGRVYVYEPQSVAERDAYQKHIKFDGQGATISMNGIVDGIIARVRIKSGAPMFSAHHRQKLIDMPADTLLAIWHAIGGEGAKPISNETVEAAEKK